MVTSSDLVRLPYYLQYEPVYKYEKHDKKDTLHKIIKNYKNLTTRLAYEPDTIKIKRIKNIIKNYELCLLNNKEYIETQMQINLTQIINEKSL